MLENAGGDVVHTLMFDSEGFEIVARRHRDLDISDFRVSRAGMTQRERSVRLLEPPASRMCTMFWLTTTTTTTTTNDDW